MNNNGSVHKVKINFAIIAHIDHGKSTLSDCLILHCGGLTQREMQDQVLDSLQVERERGITVKSQCVILNYNYNNTEYMLNLIDTPGHVDFNMEVRRFLLACEGVILLVDASKGIQAQTIANLRLARDQGLYILPVVNKIDLPHADPERVCHQIKTVLGIDEEPVLISSKTKLGIDNLMKSIATKMPYADQDIHGNLKAMIIDSYYDVHLGIVMIIRIFRGQISVRDEVTMFSSKKKYKINMMGVFTPKKIELHTLSAGMTGYVVPNLKTIDECMPGDTIYSDDIDAPVPGFKTIKPCVFCGLYPANKDEYVSLKRALEKLKLNDIGLLVQNSNIPVLGNGFRCGFLGLLHMEVIQQRLQEEFGISVTSTSPGVFYNIEMTNGNRSRIEHPNEMTEDPSKIKAIFEPWAVVEIFVDKAYIGPIMELCNDRRAIEEGDISYIDDDQVIMRYAMPLSEIIYDFHDKLKSITRGYASFDYELSDYKEANIVTLRILVHGDSVDSLSCLIHKSRAEAYGRWICKQLKESIDRQQFPVAIQAAIGGKIIARETVSAFRKDVTAKCYGGDVTRKRKLLDNQKKGKKMRMQIGKVSINMDKMRSILSRKGSG